MARAWLANGQSYPPHVNHSIYAAVPTVSINLRGGIGDGAGCGAAPPPHDAPLRTAEAGTHAVPTVAAQRV